MAREKKILFEGVEDGHEDAKTQFEKATGKKFNPNRYEIIWSGTEQSDDYGAITEFKIVNKSRPNRNMKVSTLNKTKEQQEKNIKQGGEMMEEEIVRRKGNPYWNLSDEELESRLHELNDEFQYRAHQENGMESHNDDIVEQLTAIEKEISRRKENPYWNLSDEELESRLQEITEEFQYRAHQENGMESHDDDILEQLTALQREKENRKNLTMEPTPEPIPESIDNEYDRLLGMYNEDLERLYELQEKYENNEIDYSEYENYSNYMVGRYRMILNEYNKEMNKHEQKYQSMSLTDLQKTLDELQEKYTEEWNYRAHNENGMENHDDEFNKLDAEIKFIKSEINKRKENPYWNLSDEELENKLQDIYHMGAHLGIEMDDSLSEQLIALEKEKENRKKHPKNNSVEKPEKPMMILKKENKEIEETKKDYCNIVFDSEKSIYDVKYRINDKEGELYTKINKELFSPRRKVKDAAVARLLDGKYINIFEGFDRNKIKHYDAKLIAILYHRFGNEDPAKGIQVCREYLTELSKGKDADKSKLSYEMKYDLNAIKDLKDGQDKKLNLFERIAFERMARKNKYVAKVEPERKLNKKWIAILAAIGIGGAALALGPGKGKEKEDDIDSKTPVSDTLENTIPDKDENDKMTNPELHKGNKDKVKTPAPDKGENEDNNKTTVSFSDSIGVSDEVKQEIENIMNNYINNGANQQNNKEQLKLGSAFQLPEGMEYSENVFGGRKGKIGNEYSPVDGFYVIDYAAEVGENNVSNRYGLEGEIQKSNDDSKQFVHVSFVQGAKSLEEAQKIINENKDKAKNGVVDKNIIQPRGWVDKDTIEQIYQKQQNQQQNQQTR